LVAGGVLAAATLLESEAYAYDGMSHLQIVDAAWQTMVASQDPAFTTGRGMFERAPEVPKSLRKAPDGITQKEWNKFLEEMHAAILAFNRMPSGLTTVDGGPCVNVAPQAPLGQIDALISTDFKVSTKLYRGDNNDGNLCGVFSEADLPHGIFANVGMGGTVGFGGDLGMTRAQGLVLGWHAKAGDDNYEDTVLNVNLAQAFINLPIPSLRGLSLNELAQGVLISAAAPIACIVAFLSDENCYDTATHFSHSYNPVTALAGLMPPIDADAQDDMFGGMPHFINALGDAGTPANYYDDRRGMLYESAGPMTFVGAFDLGIMVALEKTGAVMDYDVGAKDTHALAIDRYSLGQGVGDHHPEVRAARSAWEWNRETAGHTQLTPIDNFGYYGWKLFRDDPQHSVKHLRWPLHAIGDATVPMHVTSTTGWGHRAYEDAFNDNLTALRYQQGNTFNELGQAARILEQAFAVRQWIKEWRTNNGETTDVPVRDLVTKVALETVDTVKAIQDSSPDTDWYCDGCSVDYLENGDSRRESIKHYSDDAHVANMRVLYEHAVAYTLAFLVSAAETPLDSPICAEAGSDCSIDMDCCVGTCGADSKCVTPDTPLEQHGCNAANPCAQGDCINGYCEGGTECTTNKQCGNGNCNNGYCTTTCTTPTDCASGGCNNGQCCVAGSNHCENDADCCAGACVGGTCRVGEGAMCSADAECVRGRCDEAVCNIDCSQETSCGPNSTCEHGLCCVAENSACQVTPDCCGNDECRGGFCKTMVVK
jgi:hypothetical protein